MNAGLAELINSEYHGLLSEEQVQQQLVFVDELMRWNRKINLTAVDSENEAVIKHVLDSLKAEHHIDNGQYVIDVGSGGGVPVLPLAIARPHANFISVESVGKKINFQQHVKRKLGLTNVRFIQKRVEDLRCGIDVPGGGGDVVVSRALATLDRLVQWVAPILKPGGLLLAFKGPTMQQEIKSAGECFSDFAQGCQFEEYQLPLTPGKRYLLVARKKPAENNR